MKPLTRAFCAALIALAAVGCSGNGIRDAASLPDHFSMCGRDWHRSLRSAEPLDAIRQRLRVEPVVVDPGPFAPCPKGPCTNVASEACNTVVEVRVGQAAYVDYELEGGP